MIVKFAFRNVTGSVLLLASWVLVAGCGVTTVRVEPGTAIATPQDARDEVRKIRAANGGRLPPGGICVEFADGTYALDAPLVLDAQDSGTEQEPIVWRAAHRGKAVFTGGRVVTRWRPATDERIRALLPETARAHVLEADVPGTEQIPDFGGGSEECYARRLNYPFWLYQDGRRLPCARYPNATTDPLQLKDSFIFTTGTLGGTRNDNALGERSVTGIISCDSPRLAVWAKEPDLWAYGTFLHEYADIKMAVTNIDVKRKALALDNRWYPRGFTHGRPFYVFNAFSELDQPGEWVLDRAHRRVYLWPHADVRTCPPAMGVTPYLLTATNLMWTTFDGFSLEQPRKDAFMFENCRHVHLRGSTVRLTGAWGVTVRGGENVVVEGCDLTDLGEGGIRLEGGEQKQLVPARHRADNNHISHYGQVIPSYRPGVSLAGIGNAATHNLIHHTLHQGIWFNGNNHHIAWNVIHDTCLFNDDAGAIYCCQRDWTKRGTVIEHNLVYATGKRPFATNDDAIYLDDFSSGIIVQNNIIVGCTRGLHIGGGNGNTVVSNLFVGCESALHLGARRSASFGNVHEKGKASHLYATLVRNQEQLTLGVWGEAYPDIKRLLAIPDIYRAHDPIFSTIRDNVRVASGPFLNALRKDIAPYTIETNNVVFANADFVDYVNLDFRLKADSPVRTVVGDAQVERMGLYASASRASSPVKFGVGVTRPIGMPVRPFPFAVARIDVWVDTLPEGVTAVAADLMNCGLLSSQKGMRVYAPFPHVGAEWQSFTFSFTPTHDATAIFACSGAFGSKTEYRHLKVTGTTLQDIAFAKNWKVSPWRTNRGDPRDQPGENDPPYGVLDSGTVAANHVRQTSQRVVLKQGVPVTVAFEARTFIPGKH